MSFGGSCILTGIGALAYKFDRNQQFERLPESDVLLNKMNTDVYRKKLQQLKIRIPRSLINYFKDFFDGTSHLYPIKGVIEVTANVKLYSVPMLTIFTSYSIMYSLVSIAYWATITPMYTAGLLFLGPPGLAIAIIHTFLHTNALTLMFMRMSHLQSALVKRTVTFKNYQSVSKTKPIKFYVPILTNYFWFYYLPKKILKYTSGLFVFLGLMGVCSIPVIGPFLYTLAISPFISRIYVSNIYRLRGMTNKQRYDNFLDHLGKYTVFGIYAGVLELLPVISGLALTTNSVGATLWGMDDEE
ncbi:hypothetical protein Kpol_1040p19 [Vanderwaltozyma polyspora DSM 70294]|uniref:Outer spore wall protein RRT8 n=1 Tax=Vanderwaltozyma polyspora (strain ATCC 22028 / DSM 70294 / BCRC 21397 / CBS 2163 / NBRC 10782 / NRRL Y-8283 / UCD 57-17) TaxID=436907 RepID=A7TPL4_VANPO|nr:uncharacterized protein Kpol_1040p19 [Vanderwaltozyma polyspora DSM 70294]EDO15806.1 hypothetical protein Kpol_1040p19 [Vanderwaltozyma polyspora DSM 70294]